MTEDFTSYGLGFIDDGLTTLERFKSWFRSSRVEPGYMPRAESSPGFQRYFEVWNQHSTGACVGFGLAQMALIQARAVGLDPEVWSPFPIYLDARLRRQARPNDKKNPGCKVRDGVYALNKSGPIPDRLWPCHEYNRADKRFWVDRDPPASDLRARLVGRKYKRMYKMRLERIVETGPRAIQRIAHSLEKGQVVGVSIPVSRDFDRRTTDPISDGSGRNRGYHFVVVLDYLITASGEVWFLLGNSWGYTWGEKGTRWATPEFMKNVRSIVYCESIVA